MSRYPLDRQCLRTICTPLWSGCDEPELCNGLDDDCDGIADNDVDCGSGDPCPEGPSRCAGACVDLGSSAEHCGRCGRDCAGRACVAGFCR